MGSLGVPKQIVVCKGKVHPRATHIGNQGVPCPTHALFHYTMVRRVGDTVTVVSLTSASTNMFAFTPGCTGQNQVDYHDIYIMHTLGMKKHSGIPSFLESKTRAWTCFFV